MMFFVPDCSEASNTRKLIEKYGGIVIYIVECCSYQIFPEEQSGLLSEAQMATYEKEITQNYNKGLVFSSNWIVESIAS